jgi:hypothetical protein
VKLARGALGLVLAAAALATVATTADAAPVSVKPGNAEPIQFAQSLQCVCHGMLLDDWQQAMHSKALDDPLFKVKVAEVDEATGGKFGKFCRRCHGPVANMTSQDGLAEKSPAASQGVVCSFCHQVSGMSKRLANVPHLLEPTGMMRAQLKDAQAPHFTSYSALHESSRICGGCHNVDHPFNGMALETTYDEWKKSPQARKGLQCQDCHMSETPPLVGPTVGFAAEAAPERDNIYRMTFAGAQVALGNAQRATALLQSAAEIEMEAPDIVSAGTGAEAVVMVTNVGAGHYLPTGVTDIRQMWLTVSIVDDSGEETELGRRVFGTEFRDAKGKHPVEIQDAVGVAKDDRIPPTESITETYTIVLPAGIEAAQLRARLLYKSVPDELAKRAGVENPTTVMAEAAKRVFATEEAKAADDGGPGSTDTSAGGRASGSAGSGPMLVCIGLAVVAGLLVVAVIVRARKRKAGDPPSDG